MAGSPETHQPNNPPPLGGINWTGMSAARTNGRGFVLGGMRGDGLARIAVIAKKLHDFVDDRPFDVTGVGLRFADRSRHFNMLRYWYFAFDFLINYKPTKA